jgi:hypothetical protein
VARVSGQRKRHHPILQNERVPNSGEEKVPFFREDDSLVYPKLIRLFAVQQNRFMTFAH